MPRGSDKRHDEVWYAAYGSNLEAERFGLYIKGGTHPGTGRVTPGCRDGRLPTATAAATLPHPVLFARRSDGWDGAIAFLDTGRRGRGHVRLWRLTVEQFVDVMAQENTVAPGAIDLGCMSGLGPDRPIASALPGGWYGKVVWCGAREGVPVVTCTADWDLASEPVAAPSTPYVATMVRGLAECGHAPDTVVRYLAELDGIRGHWDAGTLAALVEGSSLLEPPSPDR